MAFVLTLIYISISLLSPAVLPQFLQGIHVLQILAVVITLCLLPLVGRSKLLAHPGTYFVTGVLLAATVSIMMTGWLGGAVDIFMSFIPIVFTFYFIVVTCTTLKRIVVLSYVLCAGALYISAQGIIAEFSGDFVSPYLLNERVAGANLYRHRGLGVIADPNDLAQVLVAVLPLMWLSSQKVNFAQRVLRTYIPSVGLAIGVYYTHSRGGIIALIAVVLFGLKDSIGVIGSTVLTAVFTGGVLALNVSGGRGLNQDDGQRISLWSQALTAFKTHPLFGVGTGHFSEYNNMGLTAHNSYVLCLAELGIIGYFFWMGSIVSTWSGLSQIASSLRVTGPQVDSSNEISCTELMPLNTENIADTSSAPLVAEQTRLEAGKTVFEHSQFNTMNVSAITQYEPNVAPEHAVLVQSAKVLRVALVGVLVSAFFISRTYSIILYIVLGLATCVQTVSWNQNGRTRPIEGLALLKRIGYVIVGSVLFLYLFVRLHGAS